MIITKIDRFGCYLQELIVSRSERAILIPTISNIAHAIFTCFLIPIAMCLLTISSYLRTSMHFKGKLLKPSKQIQVGTWNINCIPFNILIDQTAPKNERIKEIATRILRKKSIPSILFLQEGFGFSAYQLEEHLHRQFNVYSRFGGILVDSGLIVCSNILFDSIEFRPFKNQKIDLARGFIAITYDKTLYIGTHLDSKSAQMRELQFNEILDFIQNRDLPAVICGDFNSSAKDLRVPKEVQGLFSLDTHFRKDGTASSVDNIFLVGISNDPSTREHSRPSTQESLITIGNQEILPDTSRKFSDHLFLIAQFFKS